MNAKEIAVAETVNEVVNTNNVEVQVSTDTLEVTAEGTPTAKAQAVEEARTVLEEKKKFLTDNLDADKNIIESAQTNIAKAKRKYTAALQAVELPTTKVEFWEVEEANTESILINKKRADIIIATSTYSMTVTKVAVELGKDLIKDSKFEKTTLFVTDAKLFYEAEIELTDLNGNIIPKGTPNVYVSVDTAYGFWRWKTYHEANINAIIEDEALAIIEDVRIKKFSTLQDFAQYRGVNNVLSRGFNGLEKAGNAALATQNEFYKKIFEKAKELKANISVVTKYYNLGKTLNLKAWNDAMLGNVDPKFKYDLSVGDEIIDTLQSVGFEGKFLKERYMIDAITILANHKPQGAEAPLGITEVLATIKSLDKETVSFIPTITLDKVNEIYSALHEQYLKKQGLIENAA